MRTPVNGECIERLAVLSEELGEVQQVIGKILRHGFHSKSPLDPEAKTNSDMLERELGDVVCAMRLMDFLGDISLARVDRYSIEKHFKLVKWLHYPSNKGGQNV